MDSLTTFASRLGLETGLSFGGDGALVLDGDNDESLDARFEGVQLVIGSSEQRQGAGTLHITTRRVVWEGPSASIGMPYRQIVVHAVSPGTGSGPSVYLQLEQGPEGEGAPFLGMAAARAADDAEDQQREEAEEHEEEEEDDDLAELQLIPQNPTQVEEIFSRMCECSALNPDSDLEEEGGAELFFDEAEAMAGLSPEERAEMLAARAEGVLNVSGAEDMEELLAGDPARFEDDEDEEEDDDDAGTGEAGGQAQHAATGGNANGVPHRD